MSVAFDVGEELVLLGREDSPTQCVLRAGKREGGALALEPVTMSATLTVGERSWRIVPWGKGWKLAATTLDGEPVAWFDRSLRGGRLVLAPERELDMRLPGRVMAGRVRADGRTLLDLRARGYEERVVVRAAVRAVAADLDGPLLAGFATSVAYIARRFRPDADSGGATGGPVGGWQESGGFGDFGGGGTFGGGGGDGGGGGS